ncbi:OmpH family outer membrane protein [Thalassotalea ponticola]|uniref:OmpH family outer membrane protein n=1 Tax=Thalassotalea ponticola TaxID=1523392 RepID=UPI0025B54BBA|nr:OmpH family outer membrane protein [Thalassotalea ponticola]MDN3652546.1 OmpH family outer membrane protein [Thalassotalea ponticola]
MFVKNLLKSAALTAVASTMMMASSQAMAADQKIATVNVQQVISQLPQMAAIQQSIGAEFKDQVDALKQLEGDIKYKMEKRQRDEAIMSKKEIEQLEKEIVDLRQQYASQAQPLQQNLKRREQEEQQKILKLVKEAIDAVAKKDGYDIVIQQSAVAFSKPDFDISAKVVEQAGKTQ